MICRSWYTSFMLPRGNFSNVVKKAMPRARVATFSVMVETPSCLFVLSLKLAPFIDTQTPMCVTRASEVTWRFPAVHAWLARVTGKLGEERGDHSSVSSS